MVSQEFKKAQIVQFDEIWIGRACGRVDGLVWIQIDENGFDCGWDLHHMEFWDDEGCNRILVERDVVRAAVCHLFEDAVLKLESEAEQHCELAGV